MVDTELQRIKQRFRIVGNASALNHAIEVAVQVAPTPLTVLILGENGSGKESFSKIIHHFSPHKHGKFVAINCGAIPEGTIDSELFGHEKGSFTGAIEARQGYFEAADEGTIFLDEIAELPLGTQARLLRVLESGEFIKVGSSQVQTTTARVIAATNVDLQQAVAQGTFREDLYYRLSTVPITVPALRERGEDIYLLFRRFAADFASAYDVPPLQLTPDAKERLLNYRFPGNIRQLKNLVEQMSVLATDRSIDAATLQHYLPEPSPNQLPARYAPATANTLSERELLYKVLFDMKADLNELKGLVFELLSGDHNKAQLLEAHPRLFTSAPSSSWQTADGLQVLAAPPTNHSAPFRPSLPHELSLEVKEKELITKALEHHKGKKKLAAQSLGISERTLYRKIKQYGLNN